MRSTGRKMSRAQFSTRVQWQAKTLSIIHWVARSCKIQAHWWSQWIRPSLMPMLPMWMNLSWMTDLCSSWCHNCKRLNSLIRLDVASPWGFRAKCVTRLVIEMSKSCLISTRHMYISTMSQCSSTTLWCSDLLRRRMSKRITNPVALLFLELENPPNLQSSQKRM